MLHLPFGYTYIHPYMDTLYISGRAARALHSNGESLYAVACPPLYCLAIFYRIAVEYEFSDLPDQIERVGPLMTFRERSIRQSLAYDYFDAFTRFGPPKELLLVAGAPKRPPDGHNPVIGWEHLGLVDRVTDSNDSTERLLDYTRRVLQELQRHRGAWLQWRMPVIRIVDAKLEGDLDIIMQSVKGRTKFAKLGDNIAQTGMTPPYNGSNDPWQCRPNPFDKKHVEQVLKHAGVRWSLEQ